jgi:hypothetical protein
VHKPIFQAALPAVFALALLAGCTTIDYSSPLAGHYDTVGTVVKNFNVIGTVSVNSAEKHSASPLGFVKKVEGAKITYNDLMIEAALVDADDIIDVRIDMNTGGKTTFIDWLKGWERTFTYTGKAIAVQYADNEITEEETEPPMETRFLYR